MDRGRQAGMTLLLMGALRFALLFTGCGDPPGNTIERVPVNLSDVFSIGAKAAASHGTDAGWLVPDDSGGGNVWKLDSTDLTALGDTGGNPYDGVRLWNIDGDLMVLRVVNSQATRYKKSSERLTVKSAKNDGNRFNFR